MTNLSSTVSKLSNGAVSMLDASVHSREDEFHKPSVVHIWFSGPGCCRNVNKYISLDHNMNETDFMERVRNKFHLSRAAETRIELITRTTQQVEWSVSGKRGDESRWRNYRESLFERTTQRGIYDGAVAVFTCSDLSSFVCEEEDGAESSCSRQKRHAVVRDGKRRG